MSAQYRHQQLQRHRELLSVAGAVRRARSRSDRRAAALLSSSAVCTASTPPTTMSADISAPSIPPSSRPAATSSPLSASPLSATAASCTPDQFLDSRASDVRASLDGWVDRLRVYGQELSADSIRHAFDALRAAAAALVSRIPTSSSHYRIVALLLRLARAPASQQPMDRRSPPGPWLPTAFLPAGHNSSWGRTGTDEPHCSLSDEQWRGRR